MKRGEQIKQWMESGKVLKVVKTGNKDHSKPVIEFRIHDDDDRYSIFRTVTKYQALRYMSEDQKDNLALFEEAMRLKKRDGISFGRHLDNLKIAERRCQECQWFRGAWESIKSTNYTEL